MALELDAYGLAHVPTCAELGRRRLARQTAKGDAAPWIIEPAGYAEIQAAMKHNAEVLKADGDLRRRLEVDAIARARRGLS